MAMPKGTTQGQRKQQISARRWVAGFLGAGSCRGSALLECGAGGVLFSVVGPEWRNWQTRWTQNPVVLSTVWVRPPPPGPCLFARVRPALFVSGFLGTDKARTAAGS